MSSGQNRNYVTDILPYSKKILNAKESIIKLKTRCERNQTHFAISPFDLFLDENRISKYDKTRERKWSNIKLGLLEMYSTWRVKCFNTKCGRFYYVTSTQIQ